MDRINVFGILLVIFGLFLAVIFNDYCSNNIDLILFNFKKAADAGLVFDIIGYVEGFIGLTMAFISILPMVGSIMVGIMIAVS